MGRSVSGELAVILWVAITPSNRKKIIIIQKSIQCLIAIIIHQQQKSCMVTVWLITHLQLWSLSPERGPAGLLLWNPHSFYLCVKELKTLTLAEVNPLWTTKTGGSLKIDNYRASRSYCTALEMSCWSSKHTLYFLITTFVNKGQSAAAILLYN